MKEIANFEEYRTGLIEHYLETVHFLSNQKKSDRERCVCAAFLRCLGVDFSVEELVTVAKSQEPPDVIFREACFEVCEVLDRGRKRHHEVKARAEHLKQAKTMEDMLVSVKSPAPLGYAEIFNHVAEALAKKAAQYGVKVCAKLDALVCVSLQYKSLNPNTSLSDYTSLLKQGWRSVAFVMPPYSHVIYATDSAPTFLQTLTGQTKWEWTNPDTFFKL